MKQSHVLFERWMSTLKATAKQESFEGETIIEGSPYTTKRNIDMEGEL